MKTLSALELCAGAGGQALGVEGAGFEHAALVELDPHACKTLRHNRPHWKVLQEDLNHFDATPYRGIDLLCGGLPCPPFSKAGKQLGVNDERNLFPAAMRIVQETQPKAVMIENVRGILDAVFVDFREYIRKQLDSLGYSVEWKLLNACDYGVSQLRPRVVFVAVRKDISPSFDWPEPLRQKSKTVGDLLGDLMGSGGWQGAVLWSKRADEIAPTLVGGSHKHGGPDLGPTRARRAWESLWVDGRGIANEVPPPDFVGLPRLTLRMAARVQGFPDSWEFAGGKTQAYRQIGNAFPPPVAHAVGVQLAKLLKSSALAGQRQRRKAS
ncbi:MAG: DNA cytosine methyltransferase [Acidobacteriaceae bacterium]